MSLDAGLALGITGGIACGKSEVGKLLEDWGIPVLDTDAVAHAVMASGTPCFEAVVETFGDGIVGPDGEIDRKRLGSVVFSDPERRETLNRLVHPAVREQWTVWRAERTARHRAAAVIIPLLFETGSEAEWDAVICISAPEEAVFRRLAARGWNREQARLRIEAQMPLAEKESRSDYVIRNQGSLEDLKNETRILLNRILKGEHAHDRTTEKA